MKNAIKFCLNTQAGKEKKGMSAVIRLTTKCNFHLLSEANANIKNYEN